MRARNNKIEFVLSMEEDENFRKNVKKTGLTMSSYIRKLIMKRSIREKPDEKFYDMLEQLLKIQTNLNQIADKAEFLNDEDKEYYRNEAEKWNEFHLAIRRKYL